MSEVVTRAKFRCNSVEHFGDGPITYGPEDNPQTQWPRKFRFTPVHDTDTPENKRFAKASPCGEMWIQVDNPEVTFRPGETYYLDFTPVPPLVKEV